MSQNQEFLQCKTCNEFTPLYNSINYSFRCLENPKSNSQQNIISSSKNYSYINSITNRFLPYKNTKPTPK